MNIINLGRGQGKTTRLLYASEFNDAPILCRDIASKQYLLDSAKRLRLNIPEPITASEIVHGALRGKYIEDKDILVDEAPWVLQSLLHSLGIKGKVEAITLTDTKTEKEQIKQMMKQGF